jgi:hypothetical protein
MGTAMFLLSYSNHQLLLLKPKGAIQVAPRRKMSTMPPSRIKELEHLPGMGHQRRHVWEEHLRTC